MSEDSNLYLIYDKKTKHQYQRGKFLGKGGFAKCYELKQIDPVDTSHSVYAVKVVEKSSLQKKIHVEKLVSEVSIHKTINHLNIVNFVKAFEDRVRVYILLEMCSNNSLMELVGRQRGYLTELETSHYVLQLIEGLTYLKSQRIIHRDLKLGNIFLDSNLRVKIGDFGLAAKLEEGEESRMTTCGTPNYIAPEMLGKVGHSYAVDVWALGVITFTLLTGKPPFESIDLKSTYKRIKDLVYEWPTRIHISNDAKDFVKSILILEPLKRPSVNKLKNHPFITKYNRYHKLNLPQWTMHHIPLLDSNGNLVKGPLSTKLMLKAKKRQKLNFHREENPQDINTAKTTKHRPLTETTANERNVENFQTNSASTQKNSDHNSNHRTNPNKFNFGHNNKFNTKPNSNYVALDDLGIQNPKQLNLPPTNMPLYKRTNKNKNHSSRTDRVGSIDSSSTTDSADTLNQPPDSGDDRKFRKRLSTKASKSTDIASLHLQGLQGRQGIQGRKQNSHNQSKTQIPSMEESQDFDENLLEHLSSKQNTTTPSSSIPPSIPITHMTTTTNSPVSPSFPKEGRLLLSCDFRIKHWINMKKRYGFGYCLSNGAFGVLFIDNSSITTIPITIGENKVRYYTQYFENLKLNRNPIYFFMDSVPESINKKANILRAMKAYMLTGARPNADQVAKIMPGKVVKPKSGKPTLLEQGFVVPIEASKMTQHLMSSIEIVDPSLPTDALICGGVSECQVSFDGQEYSTALIPFVKRYCMSQKGVSFQLSNMTIQVNFFNHHKILINPVLKTIEQTKAKAKITNGSTIITHIIPNGTVTQHLLQETHQYSSTAFFDSSKSENPIDFFDLLDDAIENSKQLRKMQIMNQYHGK